MGFLDQLFGGGSRRGMPADPPAIQRIKRHELHGQAMLSLHDAKKFLAELVTQESLDEYLNDDKAHSFREVMKKDRHGKMLLTHEIVNNVPLEQTKSPEESEFAKEFWRRAEEAKKPKPAAGFDQAAFEKEVEDELKREMKLEEVKKTLRYHADLEEHTCNSQYPIGACLKCDLEKVLKI